jgi:hypothetical protein
MSQLYPRFCCTHTGSNDKYVDMKYRKKSIDCTEYIEYSKLNPNSNYLKFYEIR